VTHFIQRVAGDVLRAIGIEVRQGYLIVIQHSFGSTSMGGFCRCHPVLHTASRGRTRSVLRPRGIEGSQYLPIRRTLLQLLRCEPPKCAVVERKNNEMIRLAVATIALITLIERVCLCSRLHAEGAGVWRIFLRDVDNGGLSPTLMDVNLRERNGPFSIRFHLQWLERGGTVQLPIVGSESSPTLAAATARPSQHRGSHALRTPQWHRLFIPGWTSAFVQDQIKNDAVRPRCCSVLIEPA
jgi:hypothetical protein